MKINCITIDDELNALNLINRYIDKIDFLEFKGGFQDPIKAVHYCESHSIDLIFLDINMPEINGLQLLKSLNKEPLVIFITAYSEYAIDSFNFNVVDYLLKPIVFERFLKAANKAYKLFSSAITENKIVSEKRNGDQFINLKSNKTVYKTRIEDIVYIESLGNYAQVVTMDKTIVVYCSLNQVIEELPDKKFIRVHKSYIINSDYIKEFNQYKVKVGDKYIPIGPTYRQYFNNQFLK